MIGAIIGDIVGSRFEWNNNKSKDFEFLTYKCFPTDDSIMSLAVAKAILNSQPDHRAGRNDHRHPGDLRRKKRGEEHLHMDGRGGEYRRRRGERGRETRRVAPD